MARADDWEAYMHVDPRRYADDEVLSWETRQALARVARDHRGLKANGRRVALALVKRKGAA